MRARLALLPLIAIVGCGDTRPVATTPYPYTEVVDRGETDFAAGDDITITRVRSTGPDLRAGTCLVDGKYTLTSRPTATLAASVAAKRLADATGPWVAGQTEPVARGTGTFSLVLPLATEGYPHVSFYGPADCFGGTYFGTGDRLLRPRRS